MFVTDEQWKQIEPYLRIEKRGRRGRPRRPLRPIFEAILFLLHTGAQWHYLPRGFPPKSTVHDYFKLWVRRRAFRQLLAAVLKRLVQSGRIHLLCCL